MDSSKKRTRRTPAQMDAARKVDAFGDKSPQNVMILSKNVWANDCKFLQFDVVEMGKDLADFLVGRGQGKLTNDAVTVDVDRTIRPFARVEL